MKTKITALAAAVTIIICSFSCNWFKTSQPVDFPITGSWAIDSVSDISTDTAHRKMGLLLLAMAGNNQPLGIEFLADSSYRILNSVDSLTGRYSFSPGENALFFTDAEDSTLQRFHLLSQSDSAFSMMSKDSLVFQLKRR